MQGSSLLTPAESQGISRLWEKNRNRLRVAAARLTPTQPRLVGAAPQRSREQSLQDQGPRTPVFDPVSLVPPRDPTAQEGLFLGKPGHFPGTSLPYKGRSVSTQLSPVPRTSHFSSSHPTSAAPALPVLPPQTGITSASSPPWGFPLQPITALPGREVQGRQGHHRGDTPRRGTLGKAEPSSQQEHPCLLPSSGGCS